MLAHHTWLQPAPRLACGVFDYDCTSDPPQFSWRAVAASAVGAGVGSGVSNALDGSGAFNGLGSQFATGLARGAVSGLAAGVAANAVMGKGGKIDLGRIATDAFGNALGNSIARGIAGGGSQQAQTLANNRSALNAVNQASDPSYYSTAAHDPLGDLIAQNPQWAQDVGPSDIRVNGLTFSEAAQRQRANNLDALVANHFQTQAAQGRSVTVKSGQTLSGIVGTNNLDTLNRIAAYNGLPSAHEVPAGFNLAIPGADVLAGVDVTRSLAQRTADGAAYYAQRQASQAVPAGATDFGPPIGPDGLRIGPTVQRSQMAMSSYSAEVRALQPTTRQVITDGFSSVVGNSRAGNVLTGLVDASLAVPEALSNLSLDGVMNAATTAPQRVWNATTSGATKLWNDPTGTLTNFLANGADGFRTNFNTVVNGDGRAMGGALFAIGTAAVPVGRLGTGTPTAVTFEGSLYRAVGTGHDPLLIHPGNVAANHRYTGAGQGGLYFATGDHVVAAEFVNNGGSLAGKQMHVFNNASVPDLLDLSNSSVRNTLGVSLQDLTRTGGTQTWRYQVTQPIGSWAQQNGYRGIIAPSAQADGGLNLILFDAKGLR